MTITTTHGPCARCERQTVQQVVRTGGLWTLRCTECHTIIGCGFDGPVPVVAIPGGVVAGYGVRR